MLSVQVILILSVWDRDRCLLVSPRTCNKWKVNIWQIIYEHSSLNLPTGIWSAGLVVSSKARFCQRILLWSGYSRCIILIGPRRLSGSIRSPSREQWQQPTEISGLAGLVDIRSTAMTAAHWNIWIFVLKTKKIQLSGIRISLVFYVRILQRKSLNE